MPSTPVAAVLHAQALFLAHKCHLWSPRHATWHAPTRNSKSRGQVNNIDIDMVDLPVFMEHRRQVMMIVLAKPHMTADMHKMLSTHAHLQDVVAEYAALEERHVTICENASERLPWFVATIDQEQKVGPQCVSLGCLSSSRRGSVTSYSDLEVAAECGHILCVQNAIPQAGRDPRNVYWGLRNDLHRESFSGMSLRLYLVDAMASDGNLEIVALLLQHRASHSTAAIDNAATNGHLDMVQYLHAQRESKCTTQAMDGAAANGHLEVVQFQHDHRTEGCTTNAEDAASLYGHDAIVRFLLAKRNEGGGVKATNGYLARGDINMVKLLALGKCTSGSVNVAAAHGHLAIVNISLATRK
ncbi:Aste57867_29 [Aphanomyces stellatus]|uniref:Aste57867_29 protein n=1 Tax=Aphanomyces stellatus TaxID=120398 RepID=A0A485K2P9_9STRA|nr:hypothetical protein As57867_000029 [Aphanomyces stellatus]VFT77255.1 Aste57867_29 [Aphanomyces stellatus]